MATEPATEPAAEPAADATQHYRPLPPHVDLPKLEHEVITRWNDADVFQRSLDATAHGPAWTFYEGPPTANGMPGTHHVEARVFKDVFPRWRTMQGYHVARQAGWDCHGLPVELAVEKELGFTGKPDIEAYGIAEFNARCRENVQRHVDAFLAMSERMGYWADYEHAYWTMTPDYVESVWWALKTIFDKGLLVEDHRVTPYCPRCGTGLSDHEVAQGYEDITDPSVYFRLPVLDGPLADLGAELLVWTTQPWTIYVNTAVAVHPDVEYVAARMPDGSVLVVAEPLMSTVLGESADVVARFAGADLERTRYQRPYELAGIDGAHYIALAEYVTVDSGTGLVGQSPAFGAEDLGTARRYGLPVVNPVGRDGHFEPDLPLVGGLFFKDADEPVMADLRARGQLYRHVPFEHAYPHCWRCHTPLMYYALPAWYIRTTEIKDQLLAQNEATNWYPATIKHGRYGDWLTNNIDWSLSRDRFWGTPLPIWRNDAEPSRMVCVGSLAELAQLSGVDLDDPHRPFVDDVSFTVPGEEGTYRRVPQVIDAWFDSGAMPFAQFGAPYRNAEQAKAAYPADFICEAIDQTRGWFYSLMAVGTLAFGESSYRNVVCLGHILAEDGRKMSKHLGNILEPIPLMDEHGADALRWFMLCSGSPWSSRRVGHKVLDEIASKVIRTYWSVASFQSLYARANGWAPGAGNEGAQRSVLDRWALSEVNRVAADVQAALEDFDTARAGRALAGYIDDLSNWYVRRSRRRFWDGDPAALSTLHECLDVLTRLLAPFVPFVTEQVWDALFTATGSVDSVHLASWPGGDVSVVDETLAEQVDLVRRLVELGRSARADSKMKTRQPLRQALISAPGWSALPDGLREQVRDELNVVELATLASAGEVIAAHAKPNFRALGRRFGSATKDWAAKIAAFDADAISASFSVGSPVVIDGAEFGPDEIIVSDAPVSGWAVARSGTDTVALDLELTHELRLAGVLREIVRLVQEARKNAGLDVSDRIELWWRVGGSPTAADAIRTHADQLRAEVLAVTLTEGAPEGELFTAADDELGLRVWLRKA
ncbi:isoleucine--tRNA ligase [uncultured Jatrophihabitans sp.]|uniref:isoleucine--tRNA ligase n=1 Tax=uncultured Jatrophihabitans sp. TaxID=1610747 RepID=UPI0035CADF3C